jgi:hypothetical protein
MTDGGTAVTCFLSVADAADVLTTSPIAVRRLIARRRIKATRLKTRDSRPGEWSILSRDLEGYIGSGAPDLQGPQLDSANDGSNPAWFSDPFNWMANRLTDALIKSGEDQSISASGFESQVAVNGPGQTVRVNLKLSPAMRSLLDGRVDPHAPKIPGAPVPTESTWFQLWCGMKLHAAAAAIISAGVAKYGIQSPAVTLYDGPEQYSEIVGGAVERVAQGVFILYSEQRAAPQDGSGANANNIPVRIEYRLPVAAYVDAKAVRLVADSAAF